jgi:16S rRNA C967 or C1407 C5-methylase (RsmB/RsmF family)
LPFLLDVKPGMRVVDTCAGAGGKTLYGSFDGKKGL